MKTLTSNLLIAAAALAATAGAARAQAMKADVPFAFRAGGAVLAPGTYRVEYEASRRLVGLTNQDTRHSSLILALDAGSPGKEWKDRGVPVMAFECGAGPCALVRVWTGNENPAVSISPGSSGGQHAPLTLIRLVRAGGE